ncbi:hypothetical protein D039_5199B, partial [Vibrio parahaemolyticus EKP-028]
QRFNKCRVCDSFKSES